MFRRKFPMKRTECNMDTMRRSAPGTDVENTRVVGMVVISDR